MSQLQKAWFALRLGWTVAWSTLWFWGSFWWRPAVVGWLAILVVALVGLVRYQAAQVYVGSTSAPLEITAQSGVAIQTRQLSSAELQALYAANLELQQRQPTARDVLINLAILADALGDSPAATRWWLQAKAIDPNFPVFTTN